MSELLRPGIKAGSYPQKKESSLTDLEQTLSLFFARIKTRLQRRKYSPAYISKRVNKFEHKLQQYSEQELTENIQQLRSQLHRKGLKKELIIESFAVIREAAGRTLEKRHFNVQLYGGWLMINGMLAEMDTGEGKTLTTTLPACTAALAGIPVHVITANDYLASRDAETMSPLYERLGLTGGSIIDGMETSNRQQIYQRDIVHTTNQQIAFDYLRDRIEIGDDTGDLRFQFRQIQRNSDSHTGNPLLLRGLCFALVDEADSVLIDEAITPLIITKTIPSENNAETYSDALYLASTLFIEKDFKLHKRTRSIELTITGEDNLENLILNLPRIWRHKRNRELLVKQALAANYFYLKDKQYVVDHGEILIIDEPTGRIMADRAWEQGLHQMIETKEGCLISDQREPQARISYQRFYSRYLRLGGASGTISEVSTELKSVYGLDVFKVTTNKPSKRKILSEHIYRNVKIKQEALIKRILQLHRQKQPVLIGTSSVQESEQVSNWLEQESISHRVLNAKQDLHEAEIIAQAGQQQSITVATNMAGRGTDIKLGPGVAELGGLHVIALSRNSSHRVDRQLYGRCARQGDPGSAEAILSLQDTALEQFYSSTMLKLLAFLCPGNRPIPSFLARRVLNRPQMKNENEQSKIRRILMKQDKQLRRTLAFSGKFE
ncbi:MAG: prepilin peptidase [Gammaproteobacteria bacterium]|nr:prepilin peptidase [Gammaproteobacteria bacterium]